MQTKVTIDGYGSFEIESDKIDELLGWLSLNSGVSIKSKNQIVREVKDNKFTGRTLITEIH